MARFLTRHGRLKHISKLEDCRETCGLHRRRPRFPLGAAAVDVVHLRLPSDGDELAFKAKYLACPAGAIVDVTLHHAARSRATGATGCC